MKAKDIPVGTKVESHKSLNKGTVIYNKLKWGDEVVIVEFDKSSLVRRENVNDLRIIEESNLTKEESKMEYERKVYTLKRTVNECGYIRVTINGEGLHTDFIEKEMLPPNVKITQFWNRVDITWGNHFIAKSFDSIDWSTEPLEKLAMHIKERVEFIRTWVSSFKTESSLTFEL